MDKDILEIEKMDRENFDNYQTEAVLGEGTYGKVYKVKYTKNEQSYALKIFKPVTHLQQMYEKEVASLKRVKGKSQFVQIFAQLDQFRQKYKGVVMEFCKGGELLKYIMQNKGLEVQDVRMFLHQIIDTLGILQQNNLAHLDIKAENFFLDSNYNLILGDFGMCEELQQPNQLLNNYRKGSPSYQIIELIRQVPYKAFDADIFAAGVTIFSIYSCLLPFKHAQSYGILFCNPAQFWSLMRKNSPNPAFQDSLSNDFIDLFMKMVHPDPSKRITLEQIKQHPFYIGEVALEISQSTLSSINENQNKFSAQSSNPNKSEGGDENILTIPVRGIHSMSINEEYEKFEYSVANLIKVDRKAKVYNEKNGKLCDFQTNIDCETLFKYLFNKQEQFTTELPILSDKSFKLKCVHKHDDKSDKIAEYLSNIQEQQTDDPLIQDVLNAVQQYSMNIKNHNNGEEEEVLKFNISLQMNEKQTKTYVIFTKKQGDSFQFFQQVALIQNMIKEFK